MPEPVKAILCAALAIVGVIVALAWCAESGKRVHGVPIRHPHPYHARPGYQWRHHEHDPY